MHQPLRLPPLLRPARRTVALVLTAGATPLLTLLLLAALPAAATAAPPPVTGLVSGSHPSPTRWYSNP